MKDNDARHHVLGEPRTGVAVHAHRRQLVHAGAVVADVTVDLDLDLGVDSARDRVRTVRVDDSPASGALLCTGGTAQVVQPLVELPQRRHCEVDELGRSSDRH